MHPKTKITEKLTQRARINLPNFSKTTHVIEQSGMREEENPSTESPETFQD